MHRAKIITTASQWAFLAVLALVVAGCGGQKPPEPSVSAVEIVGGDRTIAVGESVNLTATVTAANGASEAVTWSTSNAAVVSVTTAGQITGVAAGSATITATSDFDDDVSGSINVTVFEPLEPAVLDVEITGGNRFLGIGESVTLAVTVTAINGASEDVTWTTSNAAIVSVTDAGEITGVATGSATITATSDFDDDVFDSITVTVTEPAVLDVEIEGGNRFLGIGESVTLAVTVTAVDGASEDVTWTTSSAAIVSVTDAGQITGVATGSATITATSDFDDDVFDSITVTVTEADPSNLYVDAAAAPGGDGSLTRPLQTINAALAIVSAGGTINVAAGTYAESLFIDQPLEIVGAGANQVTIHSTAPAVGLFSEASIAIAAAPDVTLTGFTLLTRFSDDPIAPPVSSALAMYLGTSNVTLQNVVIDHDGGASGIHGIFILDSEDITLDNVTIIDRLGVGGAGIRLLRNSSDIVMTNITTSGHDGFAGVSIALLGGTMSDITLSGSFGEVAKFDVDFRQAGSSLVRLNAPQFGYVIRSSHPAYFDSQVWFYKESEAVAILDSLFNFFDGVDGALSYIQTLNPADQSIPLNTFIVGTAEGTPYGQPGEVRANGIQAALNAASTGASVLVRSGTFTGNLAITTPSLTLQGGGASSVITAATAPVVSVGANGVGISGVQVTSTGGSQLGVLADNVSGFTIGQSNLLTDPALQNVGTNAVTASNNWWGDASGPGGDGPGTGNQLIDPNGGVTVSPVAVTPWP